jgi:hypothetical protein
MAKQQKKTKTRRHCTAAVGTQECPASTPQACSVRSRSEAYKSVTAEPGPGPNATARKTSSGSDCRPCNNQVAAADAGGEGEKKAGEEAKS